MKKGFLLFVIVFLSVAVSAAAFAAPARTFILANDSSIDTITHLMTEKLAELLRAKSNGAFAVEIYPGAQMGSDVLLTQACQAGDIAFVLQTTAPQASFVPKLYVLDIPNLYRDVDVARRVLDRFSGMIGAEYERAGFKLLGFGDQHFRIMTCNKHIASMDDFKDIRIRTMLNKYHISYWKDLGAHPMPLAYSELSFSLDCGLVNAQENPLEVVAGGGFYRQQKYVINTNHLFHSISIIMSKKIFDSLTPDEQRIVLEAGRETALWGRGQADRRAEGRLETLKSNNMKIVNLSPAFLEEIKQKAQPTYQSIRSEVGNEFAEGFLRMVREIEGTN